MDFIRGALGLPTGEDPRALKNQPKGKRAEQIMQQSKSESIEADLARQEKKYRTDLMADQVRLKRAEQGQETALSESEHRMHHQEAVRLRSRIKDTQARLKSSQQQLQLHREGANNLEHALLMRDGAAELTGLTNAMSDIDVAKIVDDTRDAAAEVRDHSKMLTESLVDPDPVGDEASDDADDAAHAWRERQARRADEAMLSSAQVPSTTEPAAVAQKSHAKVPEAIN